MPRILVIHYDPAEVLMLASRIRRENFEADVYSVRGTAGFSAIRGAPPDAIVIDLTRMPSYGRAMGALLRESKSLRKIPLVFIEGDPVKTKLVKKTLPDALFTNVLRIGAALEKAIRQAPAEPMAPVAPGVPLAGKLRIEPGSTVAVMYAPEGFLEKLGPLPKDARFERQAANATVILLFVKSVAALGRELNTISPKLQRGRTLWIIWPKKASRFKTDLTMPKIAEMCSALSLSGYKVCAVDEIWSGLAVTLPRTRRARLV
jgi:hypothetical protein